jgi:hypothetical protein
MKADCLLARLLTVVYIVLAIFDVFFKRKNPEVNKSKGLFPFSLEG